MAPKRERRPGGGGDADASLAGDAPHHITNSTGCQGSSYRVCDISDALTIDGCIRVTLVFEDESGVTAYFRPDQLPDLMREMDRTKDALGRTWRTVTGKPKGWYRLTPHMAAVICSATALGGRAR